MDPAIQAVVFDHDGVLVDSIRPHFLACSALFREHGAELPQGRWAREICGSPDAHPLLFGMLRNSAGAVTRTDAQLQDRLDTLWAEHFTPENVRLMPGVRELLAALRAVGLTLAVASAADESWVRRWLRHYELDGSFATVVTGDQVPRRKPDPAVYLETAARLSVEPRRCVVFEDSVSGVAAARAAGMTVLAVPTPLTSACDYSLAHRVLPDLTVVEVAELSLADPARAGQP